MNKKNSIIFQITVFFAIIFIVINSLIVIQFLIDSNTYKMIETKRYFSAMRTAEKAFFDNLSEDEINKKIKIFDLELADINIEELKNNYDEKIDFKDAPICVVIKNGIKYISFKKPPHIDSNPPKKHHNDFIKKPDFFAPIMPKPPHEIIFIDNSSEKAYKYFWIVVLLLIDISLIWFYFFIRKKLLPLHDLKDNMIELSKGNFKISTQTNRKDEISQVANEFDNAISQLRQLRESRNLFLRNIMHELKTPITKGKLVSDLIAEDENKYTLIRVFHRLEYLLSEFARIEELTSGKIQLDKNAYRAIDILEQAFDILLLEEDTLDIKLNDDLIFNVDFELFSIALKNLIDNALKYNTNGNPEIFIEKDYIKIRNKGNKLKKEIEEYYKPFNREYENIEDGLGLGLYISNNIVKIHDLTLVYEYIDGYHTFIIKK